MYVNLSDIEMAEEVREIFSVLGDPKISLFVEDENDLQNFSAEDVEKLIAQDLDEISQEAPDASYEDFMEDFHLCSTPCIYGVGFMTYCVALLRVKAE